MLKRFIFAKQKIRKLFYLITCIFLASFIVVTNNLSVQSQELNPKPLEKLEIIDLERFSKMIDNVENKWERDYERHFKRNFYSRNRPAIKIAEHLAEIEQQANIKPAVIWAIPKEEFLQLMLITPQQQFVSEKIRGAKREILSKRIAEFEQGITDPFSLQYMPPARLIYHWMFKPLEPYLEAEQIDTLLLCTGPNLRSLPFAALHDGEQFLIEKYNLARIPAFNLTDTEFEDKLERNVLAMGASEFAELPSLPNITVELETIVPKLWSGLKLVNQAFTVENFKQAHESGNFEIVHIASHSRFFPGSPANSYIQFSDRKLTLEEIDDLELNSPQVDLLVLSSCETALGDEDAEYGFAGLAMQAGVKSAIASLWSISDAGTVTLMSEFYRQLKSTPIKSEALRKAQIAMLHSETSEESNEVQRLNVAANLPPTVTENESTDFRHPYYWSGFTIIGNPW